MENNLSNYIKDMTDNFKNDFPASIVVFLVALPLCMGIAIASGVPAYLGVISGIIGGLIVGPLSGSPLQVSGPAAGLAVMVFEFVSKFGLGSLAPLGILVGITQLLVYKFRLAEWFRAISPALIKGLLSGIGLLILASQVHVAFDSSPVGSGLKNLMHIPQSFSELVVLEGGGREAFVIALSTLVFILGWQKFAGKLSQKIPAPLFSIIMIAIGTYVLDSEVKFIQISSDFVNELNLIHNAGLDWVSADFIIGALAMAFVASAETLLSVSAVDKISGGQSDYNKEIMAQGVGNMAAGVFGALPLTGVIVRSSANVSSGAKSRGSAIMHGIWLLILTFLLTDLLTFIPISALAGILIFTGWKLLNVQAIPGIIQKSRGEAFVYFTTFFLIVCVDLLTGVVVGFLASVAVLVHKVQDLVVVKKENDKEVNIKFKGQASFLKVPVISNHLPSNAGEKTVIVDISELAYVDWAVEEQLSLWQEVQEKQGRNAKIIGLHK